jgi:hypothetical protein
MVNYLDSSSRNYISQDGISSLCASSMTVPAFRTNNKESKIFNISSRHMKANNFQREGKIYSIVNTKKDKHVFDRSCNT